MRLISTFALLPFLTSSVWAQPVLHPTNDPNEQQSYVKLEILGTLSLAKQIDIDAQALTVYSRRTGVEVGPGREGPGFRSFELFLGADPELSKQAKQMDGKRIVVKGELVIVHGPAKLRFGTGLEGLGQTEYSHVSPRYVIKVQSLELADKRGAAKERSPYVKVEVRGLLETNGTNPSLSDISRGVAGSGTIIRTGQCDLLLFLGDNDKWLAPAKSLNGKAAIARGEVVEVARSYPGMRVQDIVSLPYYFVRVTDLRAAPAPGK